jgi:hypothetical protein
VLELSAGELRQQLSEPADLCSDCSALFLDWLRAGHETPQDGAGEALADTVVASTALTGAGA